MKHTPEPDALIPVLAKIQHHNDLGLSQWYELVYFDKLNNKWCSCHHSKTFRDGEKVIEWVYCSECFNSEIQSLRDRVRELEEKLESYKVYCDCRLTFVGRDINDIPYCLNCGNEIKEES